MPDLPEVFIGSQARERGLTRHQIEWAVASGHWIALRRGIYCLESRFAQSDRDERHRLHCVAALMSHDERHVFSHGSAALTYGLPSPVEGFGRPSMTIDGRPSSTDRQEDLIVQVASLRPQDLRPWSGWRRTSPSRTVADCLRHLAMPDAVAVADGALSRGLTTIEALIDVLEFQEGWPYITRALWALAAVDGRRESWLESYSFATLHQFDLPLPTPQVTVRTPDGEFVARVDGLWLDSGVVAEADGLTKYGVDAEARTLVNGESADNGEIAAAMILKTQQALIAEKRREDRLRALGLEVVRWGTADILHRPHRVLADIHAAMGRTSPARVTARTTVPSAAGLAVGTGLLAGRKRA